MLAVHHPHSDADLLARYLREGCEASFAALVAAHERMVLGTALRRTGDAELARDVAQQVFALLARKAAWLAGRESLAGWLHRAASYLGARAVRSEARARARHEALARETAETARDAGHWAALDDELSALSASEREALVLHYFEDRSYAEMAATLGVSEAAARQRVSRGLRALGTRLRRRGIGASAAALLAGGAALQSTLPAQAGVAAAALSGSAIATPAALFFTTIMSHTAAKFAVAAIALAALPVAWLQHTNARLTAERTAQTDAAVLSRLPPSSGPAPASPAAALPEGELLAAWQDLRAAQTSRREAEEKLAARQRQAEQVETEVVVSYGQVEDLARRLARQLADLQRLEALKKEPDPAKRAQFAREVESTMQDFGNLFVTAREAQKFESDPEKAARFYAALLGERAGLDPAEREPLARIARERFAGMARAGLIAAQRPRDDDKIWKLQRLAAFAQLEEAMLATLPATRRSEIKNIAGLIAYLGGDLFPADEKEAGK